MMQSNASAGKLNQKLGYAGLIPFALCLAAPWVFADQEAFWFQAFCLYSALILAFMAGSLWGQQIHEAKPGLAVLSNVLTLMAFASFLLPPLWQVLLLALAYAGLLRSEKQHCFEHYSLDYRQLRERLNGAVMGSHCLMIFNALALQNAAV